MILVDVPTASQLGKLQGHDDDVLPILTLFICKMTRKLLYVDTVMDRIGIKVCL